MKKITAWKTETFIEHLYFIVTKVPAIDGMKFSASVTSSVLENDQTLWLLVIFRE